VAIAGDEAQARQKAVLPDPDFDQTASTPSNDDHAWILHRRDLRIDPGPTPTWNRGH
jgi:hypothetical protein